MGLFKHEVKNVFLLRLSIRELYSSATCQVGLRGLPAGCKNTHKGGDVIFMVLKFMRDAGSLPNPLILPFIAEPCITAA